MGREFYRLSRERQAERRLRGERELGRLLAAEEVLASRRYWPVPSPPAWPHQHSVQSLAMESRHSMHFRAIPGTLLSTHSSLPLSLIMESAFLSMAFKARTTRLSLLHAQAWNPLSLVSLPGKFHLLLLGAPPRPAPPPPHL